MNRFLALLSLLFITGSVISYAQTDSLRMRIETHGVLSTGSTAPFWTVHGKEGLREPDARSAQIVLGGSYHHSISDRWDLSAELSGIVSTGRTPFYHLQRAGVSVSHPLIELKVGALPYRHSLDFSTLSSGAMTMSDNISPIPMVMLRTPDFLSLPYTQDFASVYVDFGVGKLWDGTYLAHYIPERSVGHYTLNPNWHSKAFYLRLGRRRADFPLLFTLGGIHAAQWGGKDTREERSKPATFSDFLRVVLAKSGGEEASVSDQINVLGNHFGHYLLQLDYYSPIGRWQAYNQHYFEDKSGMEWSNGGDGLWGVRWCTDRPGIVKDLLVEYLTTLNQSGGFHILQFHRPNGEGRGGGADNYYNNGEYAQGTTYMGMGIGNPLLLSPLYNTKPMVGGFRDNRLQAVHFGMGGDLPYHISYSMKLSWVKSMGLMGSPHAEPRHGVFSYISATVPLKRIPGLTMHVEGGLDGGDYTPKSAGLGIGLIYCPSLF